MIQATRLSGEIIYLNYLQIEYIELIPETKITMMNGDYYLVKDKVESIWSRPPNSYTAALPSQIKRNKFVQYRYRRKLQWI